MEEKKIELTKEELITLLGCQLHKCNCVTEHSDLVEIPEKGLVWSGMGTGLKEGIVYIPNSHKESNSCLLIKLWENEEDIPRVNLIRDNSDKVQNILIPYENTKFYIVYVSYIGLKIIIENVVGEGKGSQMVRYSFVLTPQML